jgi:hypothetical protein
MDQDRYQVRARADLPDPATTNRPFSFVVPAPVMNRKERKERREEPATLSLCSLRSLRLVASGT